MRDIVPLVLQDEGGPTDLRQNLLQRCEDAAKNGGQTLATKHTGKIIKQGKDAKVVTTAQKKYISDKVRIQSNVV